MPCSACSAENPPDSRFCLQCGAALGSCCASCGAELPSGARFCNQCGSAVTAAEKVTEKERPLRDREPRAYTPKQLADKILASKSALEGERKQVTVLFADVKGSMELAEAVDPEELHRILDRFFSILADGVHRFEGTINQYTGDGIMVPGPAAPRARRRARPRRQRARRGGAAARGVHLEETGARAWVPLLHETRAELERACGDAPTAERELREAQRLYAEMGATGHAERLAHELGG